MNLKVSYRVEQRPIESLLEGEEGRKKLGLGLENPKRFLPLLLFIGFVFALFGMGWQTFTNNSGLTATGGFLIFIAVLLWILTHQGDMGF